MALYCKNGRPFQAREFIESRYEACEDLAHQVSGFCSTTQFKDDLSEEEVLRRCHAGLMALPDAVPAEAAWVVCRAAELLDWAMPAFLQGDDAPAA